MTAEELLGEIRLQMLDPLPLPGEGRTAERHRRLLEMGRRDLSLARLAEAHWDAVAILAEAGRTAEPGAIYGVWAAERPKQALRLREADGRSWLRGTKPFCSGAGLVDRALVTAEAPEPMLLEVELRGRGEAVRVDDTGWTTSAFAETRTAEVTFCDLEVRPGTEVGPRGWYLRRPGFWHGACGPAACWAGGAAGLLDYARSASRSDTHTLAHLGAMEAAVWAMRACLRQAGDEIDGATGEAEGAGMRRALAVRHVIEQGATECLSRLGRAFGPHPMAMNRPMSRRYAELELYLRQCHAERDLESLGRSVRESRECG